MQIRVLTNAAYRDRYRRDNANPELVQRPDAAGVRFVVCGQSIAFGGFDRNEPARPAQLAVSAMTMLMVLQNDGYALLAD